MHRTSLVFAAVLAASGLTFVGCQKEETANAPTPATQPATPGERVGHAIDATTQKISDAATQASSVLSATGANNLQGVRNVVQYVTEKATERNTFKDIAGYFPKADEDRVVNSKPETKDLDDLTDVFNTAFKAKYGYTFKIKDQAADYPGSFLQVTQDAADPNKASATLFTSSGALTVPFVREGSQWKIAVPASLDGNVLCANLVNAFTTLNKAAPTWPATDAEADQVVTRAIFAAILNQQ